MRYYIGSDLGTSALKLLLVDIEGNVKKEMSRSYPVNYPNPGWSEQSPEEWWKAFTSGLKELIEGIEPHEIIGIGSGGQISPRFYDCIPNTIKSVATATLKSLTFGGYLKT